MRSARAPGNARAAATSSFPEFAAGSACQAACGGASEQIGLARGAAPDCQHPTTTTNPDLDISWASATCPLCNPLEPGNSTTTGNGPPPWGWKTAARNLCPRPSTLIHCAPGAFRSAGAVTAVQFATVEPAWAWRPEDDPRTSVRKRQVSERRADLLI